MSKKNIVHVVGARPNFMKLAPVYAALQAIPSFTQYIIHTGQHFDHEMSDIFFEELGINPPDINLNIAGASVLEQIGLGILKLAVELPKFEPSLVVIYGDVNATAVTSIVCSKLGIKLAHVEAGLRSFDRQMPEETNRIIADSLSDYFFTPSQDAVVNLEKAGACRANIFNVGNVMIDTLVKFLPKAETAQLPFDLPQRFVLVTLHRPSNVDTIDNLMDVMNYLNDFSDLMPVVFPLHPRTRAKLSKDFVSSSQLILSPPLGYVQFLKLQTASTLIITDSGGIQEESTYLGIPCFTLRDNTERPITVQEGTNILVGTDLNNLKKEMADFMAGKRKPSKIPQLWDGKASARIATIIHRLLEPSNSVIYN